MGGGYSCRGDVRNFLCHWILTWEDKTGLGGEGRIAFDTRSRSRLHIKNVHGGSSMRWRHFRFKAYVE